MLLKQSSDFSSFYLEDLGMVSMEVIWKVSRNSGSKNIYFNPKKALREWCEFIGQ